jgi:putative integral membrane protein (TIGR02587 family)
MPSRRRKPRRQNFRRELSDLIRATSGGFLFGVPLLYTMEVWWIGSSVDPPIMLVAIAALIVVAFALNLTGGFRKSHADTAKEALSDAFNAVAVGFISAALMLVLLQEITVQTQLRETLGKIIFEGVPFAMGAALANQFLQPAGDDSPPGPGSGKQGRPRDLKRFFPENNLNETLTDVGATLIGALIVAFSIAPTEEVPMLVSGVQGPRLMGIILASLVISYMIVFQANFTSQSQRQMQQGLFQSPISETIMSYLVSLAAAAVMLGFFPAN